MHKPLDLQPTDRMLRQFAGLWSVVFLFVTARMFAHGYGRIPLVLGAVAVAIGLVSLMLPRTIRPVFVAAMVITYPIGWVVSHVILGLLFYGLFTPIGVFFRVRGRDVLGLKPQRHSTTYWQLKPPPRNKSQYLRPF